MIRRILFFTLLILFIHEMSLYIYEWVNYFDKSRFFREAINIFYSLFYLYFILVLFYWNTIYSRFILLIILPFSFLYKLSGILHCCETPFEYTILIYSQFRDLLTTSFWKSYITKIILGLPYTLNSILFVYTLISLLIKRKN
jgi:hypothetical protein